MIYEVRHKTCYRYSEPASLSQNELYLYPRSTPVQSVISRHLEISPDPDYLRGRYDYYGNQVNEFMVQQTHNELTILAQSKVETSPSPSPDPAATPDWESVADRIRNRKTVEDLNACQFLYESPMVTMKGEVLDYARLSFWHGATVLQGALDLTRRIHSEFTYEKGATTVDTPVQDVLRDKRGVCQDFAHLQIACLRSIGLAARYVSGYLETNPAPGQEKMIGADGSHAWLSIYIPDIGWVDLDPTNNLIPAGRHITVAWGRDYGDVTPVRGIVMGGGTHTMLVTVDVMPSV